MTSEELFISVPRPGIEPGRISPMVFETIASTNSAIGAYLFDSECKGKLFFSISKQNKPKNKKINAKNEITIDIRKYFCIFAV